VTSSNQGGSVGGEVPFVEEVVGERGQPMSRATSATRSKAGRRGQRRRKRGGIMMGSTLFCSRGAATDGSQG
jgi:hypothetical protein